MSVTLFASTMPFMSLISTSLSSVHPPLCYFGGGVQLARQISLQLVLVQILILKGGLTKPVSEKMSGRSRREERNPHGLVVLFGCLPCN